MYGVGSNSVAQRRTRERKNATAKVWDCLDYELRSHNVQKLCTPWKLYLHDKLYKNADAQKRMNDAVGALKQTLRNNPVTRSGRPTIPEHWTFRFFPGSHEIFIDYGQATRKPYSQVPPGDWSIPQNKGTRHSEALPSEVAGVDAPAQLYSNSSDSQESWPAPINNDRSDIDDENESEPQHASQDEFMGYLPERNDASLVAESWPNSGEEDQCVEDKLDSRPVDMMQLDDNESELGMPQARPQTKNKQPLTIRRMFLKELEAHGQKDIPREVWDYVDWQMWNLDIARTVLENHWQYIVLGKTVDYEIVDEMIGIVVPALEQSLRKRTFFRPPCPELPRHWDVRLIAPIRKMCIFYSTSSSAIDAFLEGLPVGRWPGPEWLPSGTVVRAVSVNGESSWNPKNELFQSRRPQIYEFMKGSPMSIRQSSVKSTRLSAMKMLSSSMRSIKL